MASTLFILYFLDSASKVCMGALHKCQYTSSMSANNHRLLITGPKSWETWKLGAMRKLGVARKPRCTHGNVDNARMSRKRLYLNSVSAALKAAF